MIHAHSPGPWKVIPRSQDKPPSIIAGEYADEGEPDMVAEVYGSNEEADARLIAAAPNMYEALTALLDLWPLSGYELEAYINATFLPAARAAVAKARGESTC